MDCATQLLKARLETGYLENYPSPAPSSLEEAYTIQDKIIAEWPDEISGWKVGRILGQRAEDLGCNRLSGPIFKKTVRSSDTASIDMPVFPRGFAAVEAECVAVIGADAPANKTSYTRQEALDLISSMCLGVEVASSPFPGINDNGPMVTISDLGNNYGLIVGSEIPNWRELDLDAWTTQTFIDEACVGEAEPSTIPGGPVESVRFLLENTARRGLPLKRGMLVSTGAITGVHQISVGQSARATLKGAEDIKLTVSPVQL